MGFIRWGGKKFYPQKPQPYKPDVNELMKPLSEKAGKGNIWGSVIMKVPETTVPVSPTPTPTKTSTPTPTVTPTNTVTPTPSITPTYTPTPSPIYDWLLIESGDALTTEENLNIEYNY